MAKKIKRSKTEGAFVDPNLDEVDEERAFEIDEDEEEDLVVFIFHYRRKWGDDFDADIDHVMNPEEAGNMIGLTLQILDSIKTRQLMKLGLMKVTPAMLEGNPMQGPRVADGPVPAPVVAVVEEKKGGESGSIP